MTYQETLDFLYNQLPVYQKIGKRAFKKDLTNIRAIADNLGNPQNHLRCIHIAGTNGKGSTSHMIASVLQEAEFKVGLYTSPHLKDFRERIRINGKEISESEVISFVEKHKSIFKEINPSFFEWTVGLAFNHFKENKVDFAVIETGLGGRLDSTNIINPILSIITNIGFDHMDMLGDTLDKIAYEKAGIIKDSIPVIIGNACDQEFVFINKAKSVKAPIYFAKEYPNRSLSSDLKGLYQKENIHTTDIAITVLKKKFAINDNHLIKGIKSVVKNTRLRGRWEVIQKRPKIIIETAHNLEGFQVVSRQLSREKYDHLTIILGFVKQKPIKKIVNLLPKNAKYIITKANIDRSEDPKLIAQEFEKNGINSFIIPNVAEAIMLAKSEAKKEDMIYIGGSNFIVSEAIDFFDKEFEI